jgi:sulfite exporter TauE/SafE
MASYAVAGALAAAGVGILASTSAVWPVLRPLWTMLHLAAVALGLWLMMTGRQPTWMSRIGRARDTGSPALSGDAGWKPLRGPVSASMAASGSGLAWVLWPCGLLQSALVVAGLANTPQGGAMAMLAFAATSAPGLQWAPWAWRRWAARGDDGQPSRTLDWAVRGAGLALALGSAWALGHDAWAQVWDYCFG